MTNEEERPRPEKGEATEADDATAKEDETALSVAVENRLDENPMTPPGVEVSSASNRRGRGVIQLIAHFYSKIVT